MAPAPAPAPAPIPSLELRPLSAADAPGAAKPSTLLVLDPGGQRLGHLKRIGAVWKFKAIGETPDGELVPGGGPLTERHNAVFAPGPDGGWPDADAVARALLGPPRG